MNVKLLGMTGTELVHYSSEPEKAIIHLMCYGSPTLIMEPGELLDFAQGHKLLTNSNAEIVILGEEPCYIEIGDNAIILPPVDVAVICHNSKIVRHITPSYLTAYK